MDTAQCVTICLTIADTGVRALARYSLEEAFVRLGQAVRVVGGEPASGMIVYGPVPAGWRGATLRYDRRSYDPSAVFASVGTPPLWGPQGIHADDVDLIGGIGRLLTLADEQQVSDKARNGKGTFPVSALPAGRRLVGSVPLVEHHVAALGRQLGLHIPFLRWQGGRRYAVLITHDTDSVALDAPQEILFSAVKAVLRHDPLHARLAWDGISKKMDPLSSFRTWAAIESAAGVCSAFFLFNREIVRRHLNDCRSTVFNQRVDWAELRVLADRGWEFGCHPPIRAKDNLEEFLRGKRVLEEHLDRPIYGLRHHYWALDWRRPYLTFRKHVQAGFRYDMSIAWRNATGYRAGTSMPYRPFDPELGRALDLYELPTMVMDSDVIGAGVNTDMAFEELLRTVQGVRDVGGVLVLDWHTETGMEKHHFRTRRQVLVRLIQKLLSDSDAWFTTPWELTQHWMERRKRLSPERMLTTQ